MAAGGWYRDPTGRQSQRYWDGTRWTEHTIAAGGAQDTDPITGDYAAPVGTPAGVRPPRRRRVWPWVLAAVLVLGLGGCALIVVAVDNAVDELNAEQRRHAISEEQFAALELGTPKVDVIAQLGKQPEDSQEFVSEGVVDETEIRSSCIYYNVRGGEFGDRYQLCFDGQDLLDAKNAYR